MAQSHKYVYEFSLTDENHAGPHVLHFVGRGKRVLDVGSGPGSITRFLKDPGGCRIVALENDPVAAAMVAPFCERVLACDLNSQSLGEVVRAAGGFDVVVLADVLEHLHDPWSVLRNLKGALLEGGYFVVSLPHAGHNAVIASLLNADFEYRDNGLLDRTHIRFFGMRNIQALFEQAQLQIVDARFVARFPGISELCHQWNALSRQMREVLLDNPFGSVYQVVVKAQPARHGAVGLDLCALPMPDRRGTWLERIGGPLGRRLAARLDPASRRRLKRALTRLGVLRGRGSQ